MKIYILFGYGRSKCPEDELQIDAKKVFIGVFSTKEKAENAWKYIEDTDDGYYIGHTVQISRLDPGE